MVCVFSFLGAKARGQEDGVWTFVLTGNKLVDCPPEPFDGSPIKGDGHTAHDSLSWSQPSECGLSRPSPSNTGPLATGPAEHS